MNNNNFTITTGTSGITDVPGFETAGVACGIRGPLDGRLDLGLIYSAHECNAAGVFTQNDVKAAPVRLNQEMLKTGKVFHGIVVNSGNANACTGPQGKADARKMAELAAEPFGLPPESMFVCSTGHIGEFLPMDRIAGGIEEAAANLSDKPESGQRAARAIQTSDTITKTVTARFQWEGQTITLAGMAKGAGMIQPNMATMLAFIGTDARIDRALLRKTLKEGVRESFNRITVDGDMSTNDTVLILANGASGIKVSNKNKDLIELFQKSLSAICLELALMIVGDGEKISKVVEICIDGAHSHRKAEKVARAVGNSLLVKSSWAGNDPNWGRIMDAAGYANAGLEEEKIDLSYGKFRDRLEKPVVVLKKGTPIPANKELWQQQVSQPRFQIDINLNQGKGRCRLFSTDITDKYVNFNKTE